MGLGGGVADDIRPNAYSAPIPCVGQVSKLESLLDAVHPFFRENMPLVRDRFFPNGIRRKSHLEIP